MVKDEDELVGILTSKDIANAFIKLKKRVHESHQKAQLKHLLVSDVMTSNLEKVKPNAPIVEVAEKMLSTGFSGLPIVNCENELLGLIMKTDLLNLIVNLEK